MKKKYRRCSDILLETSRKGKLTDLWLSTWLILKLILKLPGLTDLWSSTWLISVTGNLKKTFRGPSAESKYLTDQNRERSGKESDLAYTIKHRSLSFLEI